jgi:hypothetical protein
MNAVLNSMWRRVESQLFPQISTPTLFNPFLDEHPQADRRGAARIRRTNLRHYFASFESVPEILLVGEASGPWGCRFSGVPFTSEQLLCDGSFVFRGKQSSTADTPHLERTASIFWEVMRPHHPRFLMWNSVPLHPHLKGEPFSLRRPARAEVAQFSGLLNDVITGLRPQVLIAVGRIAEQAVQDLGYTAIYVRHPSHGGATRFREQMENIFRGVEALGRSRRQVT